MNVISERFYDIPAAQRWGSIRPVAKGWSQDQKYYIERNDGARLLLRVSASAGFEAKQREFQIMQQVARLGVAMSIPLEFGRCNGGSEVYSLFTWIDGVAADEFVPTVSVAEQYRLGVAAGRILRRFHTIAAPENQVSWEARMLKKFAGHQERYQSCGIQVAGDEAALAYIREQLFLLKDRPQVWQHGDFHLGNLIVTPERSVGVIDFNRWDYGDPYEEFYKMMYFTRESSISFARGQLEGYFPEGVPEDFFALVALYLADVILFSVAWAVPFGPADVAGMLRRAEMVLGDYDHFRTAVPRWYQS